MLSKWRTMLPVIAILVLAAALRFWGLRWGLPDALHSYSYHPDEFLTIGAAGLVLTSFFPRFYNYPSLYLYLTALVIAFASGYGLAHDTGALYLCGRVIAASMGIGAVVAVYWAGRSLAPDRTGNVAPNTQAIALVAALILCISPIHVQHSHFATVDVPSTLFVALCLGFAGRVLSRGSWRDYLLCGVMAGLASGTKYNAALVVLSLIAAHFLGCSGRNAGLRRLLGALGCVVGAFIVSTPASVLRTRDFLYGLTYEMHHAAQGHGLVFAGTGNGFLFTFTSSLWYGLGPALAILFVAAAIYGLLRMDRRAMVLLAFVLPYYALISLSQVRFARYALPMYPAAALLTAWMAVDLWKRFHKRIRWAWAGLMGVALAGTLLYTIALDRLFVQQPPQDRAARWVFANIPKGSRVGTVEVPWFYSPPYSKEIGLGALPQREQTVTRAPYKLIVSETYGYRMPWMYYHAVDWFVMSDYETEDARRLKQEKGLLRADRALVWWLNAVVDTVRDYRLRGRFGSDLSAFGIPFGSTQSLPHDMRYPAPTIWIYELRK